MLNPKRILLASHGTAGARAAERLALSLCRARVTLHHLIVVPDFWKHMMGDDWLNNASTRATFGRYVESELEKEVQSLIARVEKAVRRRRARYVHEVVVGDPARCLLASGRRERPNLIVAGAPRPAREAGLRSRMLTEDVLRQLGAPLLVAPYPKK